MPIMTSPAAKTSLSAEDYLAMERASDIRHERMDGEILAMTGASRAHNLITLNTAAALHSQLKGRPCEIYNNDLRVKVSPAGDYVYPDIVVVCEPPRFEDDKFDTLLNPTLIVEVLSDSTEAYDRGHKFAAYRALDSLRDYVLIAQQESRVEHYVRQSAESWLLTETVGLQSSLELSSIDCRLALDEVYAKVGLAI
jgi:Uma2 family endonuclease